MFILLLSLTKIDSGFKLPHLEVQRMSYSIVLCVWMGFRPIDLCVLTVWASIRDRASIGDGRSLEHRHWVYHSQAGGGKGECQTEILK